MGAPRTMTPQQRTERARLAAQARWAKESADGLRIETAALGQAGLRAKFDREARETPGLTEAEYARRAEALYKLHFTRMRYNASRARTLARLARDRDRDGAA